MQFSRERKEKMQKDKLLKKYTFKNSYYISPENENLIEGENI